MILSQQRSFIKMHVSNMGSFRRDTKGRQLDQLRTHRTHGAQRKIILKPQPKGGVGNGGRAGD